MAALRVVAVAAVLCLGSVPALAQEADGEQLYVESCASCHAVDGSGSEYGPDIRGSGEAAVDFQLRTGRMPLADVNEQTRRKPPAFSPEEIGALVEYVGSLGSGPDIPFVDPAAGDVAAGQQLFVDNCAACHGATANGGAAGVGALAPGLYQAAALDVAEAVITGPGEMPVFDFDQHELNAIARYIAYLQERDAPGGADIGGIGPVPEGFVGWALGMLSLGLLCYLIGSKARASRQDAQ
ncbi:MAG: c-type cytochrome [Actinomycetota bacterium]|nr:c-type cytochrome [Actinomycetota bacterium]